LATSGDPHLAIDNRHDVGTATATYGSRYRLSVAMKKSPLVARSRSPLVAR
jgi:hypothetical protein